MLSGCGQTEHSRPVCPRRSRRLLAGNARSRTPVPLTAIEPSVSVRSTVAPMARRRASVPGAGCPYRFFVPTGTIASRGRTRSCSPGSWCAEPWWATLRTSTRPSCGCSLRRACCATGSRSPSSSRVSPAPRTSRTTLASLGPSKGDPADGGHSTCHSNGPARRRSPCTAGTTGTPAAAAVRRTNSARPWGSSSAVAWIIPTERPRRTPCRPPTWSAWKCVSSSIGTRRTPSSRRQSSTGPGSAPASTTTASPGATARTAASPCPTAHWT